MRWTLLVVLFTDALVGAQQTPTKPAPLPPGSSVGVRIPSETIPPSNLAAPQQIAVQGQVPDTWFAGEVQTKVNDHEYWINLLRGKIESLEESRNWIKGVFWAMGLIVPIALAMLVWLRKHIFTELHDEAFPNRHRLSL